MCWAVIESFGGFAKVRGTEYSAIFMVKGPFWQFMWQRSREYSPSFGRLRRGGESSPSSCFKGSQHSERCGGGPLLPPSESSGGFLPPLRRFTSTEVALSTANGVVRRLLRRTSSICVATAVRIFSWFFSTHSSMSFCWRSKFIRFARTSFVRRRWTLRRRRWRRSVLELRKRRRQCRCFQHGFGVNVSRGSEDNVVSLWIHQFENRNRSALENLNRWIQCLRGGRMTCVGSSMSSSHYFRGRSNNCWPLRWRNM